MHSLEIGEYTVHYNSDFSGDIYLTNTRNKVNCVVPFEVFEAIIAQKLRMGMVSKIEQMTDGEFLNNLVEISRG